MTKEWTPHLENEGNFYGMLGGLTRLRDINGKLLRVGDTVSAVHSSGSVLDETPVIFPNDGSATGSYPSVFGISNACTPDGLITGGWTVAKKRSYEECEDGEVINPHPSGDPSYAIVYCG